MTERFDTEVRHWIDRLLASAGKEKRHAAAALGALGVRTRGAVRTRGSLTRSAATRLPEPEKLRHLAECLKDGDKTVRSQVALALGEWGGQEAAKAVSEMLRTDPDEEVQLYAVTSLRNIGGPASVEGLRHAIESGSETVTEAAISAIEELATGGRLDDTENPPALQASAMPVTGKHAATPRASRVRGAAPAIREDTINAIADSLDKVRNDERCSKYLRERAGEVMLYLKI